MDVHRRCTSPPTTNPSNKRPLCPLRGLPVRVVTLCTPPLPTCTFDYIHIYNSSVTSPPISCPALSCCYKGCQRVFLACLHNSDFYSAAFFSARYRPHGYCATDGSPRAAGFWLSMLCRAAPAAAAVPPLGLATATGPSVLDFHIDSKRTRIVTRVTQASRAFDVAGRSCPGCTKAIPHRSWKLKPATFVTARQAGTPGGFVCINIDVMIYIPFHGAGRIRTYICLRHSSPHPPPPECLCGPTLFQGMFR